MPRLRSDDPDEDGPIVQQIGRSGGDFLASFSIDKDAELALFTLLANAFDLGRACGMRRLAFALGGKDYQPIGRAFSIEWEDRPLSLTLQRAGLN